jgi:two-component system CheB/CheR fusion protein
VEIRYNLNGRRLDVVATGAPIRDGKGRIVGGVKVLHDVSELVRMQDEFLALASHELRTPLTPTLGYLELALATLDEATPARRYVARAAEQVDRLNALVGDLLDVGRLRGGQMRLEREDVDLGAVVRRAVEAAEVEATAQGQAITLEASEGPLPVRGDARRLEQVALNLLTNAIRYAAQSPTIAVRLGRDSMAGQAVLEVQDTGPGIAAADLPHLFSRFYQVARPDRPSRGGLGLGLYLVRQLVEAHGGTVGVASTVGVGTTFTVRLPLAGADCALPPPGGSAGMPREAGEGTGDG